MKTVFKPGQRPTGSYHSGMKDQGMFRSKTGNFQSALDFRLKLF